MHGETMKKKEEFGVLECYRALTGSSLPTFRDRLSTLSSSIKQSKALKDGTDMCTETTVPGYHQSMLRNILEEPRPHQ
jgi:hypothetical protein